MKAGAVTFRQIDSAVAPARVSRRMIVDQAYVVVGRSPSVARNLVSFDQLFYKQITSTIEKHFRDYTTVRGVFLK